MSGNWATRAPAALPKINELFYSIIMEYKSRQIRKNNTYHFTLCVRPRCEHSVMLFNKSRLTFGKSISRLDLLCDVKIAAIFTK